jgi:putative spermidine/putrescine transport system permease protein
MSAIAEHGMNPGRIVLTTVSALVLAFLVAPVVIIVVISFSNSELLTFPPPAYSLRWYSKLFSDPGWRHSFAISLKVAFLTVALSALIGLPASFALVRGKFKGKDFVYAILLSPMIVPTIITAIALYFFFARMNATGSVVAMALGHTVLALPTVVIIMGATLQGFDQRLEQAAFNLGASRLYALRRITLPLIAAGVLSAMLFAFLTSFDDLLIPLFLSGMLNETLSVKMWNGLRYSADPLIAAVSSFLIWVTAVVLISTSLLKRRKRDGVTDNTRS